MKIRCSFLFSLLFCAFFQVQAQSSTDQQLVEKSLDRLLEIVSVEAGSQADTAALRNLCLPHCYFTVRMADDSDPAYQKVDLNSFIMLLTDDYYSKGFKEVSLGRSIQIFNGIAIVFEGFEYTDSEGNSGRGVNSIQLLRVKDEWKIANVLWTGESESETVPDYLDQH